LYIETRKTNDYFIVRELDKNSLNANLCSTIIKKVPYKSSLYLESNSSNTDFVTFKSGKSLKKFEFFNGKEFYDFKDKFKGRLHGDIDEISQYLSTREIEMNDIDLVQSWAMDIEVFSETDFPSPDRASKFPITVISLNSMKHNKTFTWVYDMFIQCSLKSKNDWDIRIFKDEKEMLSDFISFFKKNTEYIHILTGWNSENYDIPYLINRINFLFNGSTESLSNEAKCLSPFRSVKKHVDKYTNNVIYNLQGLPHLDYLKLFKKFNFKAYPSYKLEEICQEELKIGKLDHSEYISFAEFYKKNIDQYVEYNKKDVELIRQLDDKFKLITLAFNIAYTCKINVESVFSPIRCWDSLVYNELLKINVAVPPNKHNVKQDYMGAFVMEPKKGLVKDILSFDLTSLYPSVIRAMNISPENLVEDEFDPDAGIDEFLNGYIPSKYHQKNRIVDPSGNVFDKSKQGVIPYLMAKLFETRISSKQLMQQKQKELIHYKKMLKEAEKNGE
jgi:DNA polymerase elongation subunit (family B)